MWPAGPGRPQEQLATGNWQLATGNWQLAEYAGHQAPHSLQQLLAGARWDADEVRDDLQTYAAEQLGAPEGVFVIDDIGFVKRGVEGQGRPSVR